MLSCHFHLAKIDSVSSDNRFCCLVFMMAIASRSVRWNAFSRESFIHTVMRCSSPVLYDYIVVSYVLYDITTGVKIDRLCTCIVLHAPRAPRATSQISVTFRRDTMVDAADPDVPSGVAAGEGGAAPAEVPSGARTRCQRDCTDAAAAGDLTRLKRANENGCPWDKWVCEAAAEGGQLECLTYLHENGCAWDKWACEAAARGGHLECLKYLHENGCPWNERTCRAATRGGHLGCLKYLREHNSRKRKTSP